MYNIIWSKPAKEDYWQNIDFLLENWNEKQVHSFIDAVDLSLNIISINPKTFALTDYRNVRSALIVKQVTLFYRINGTNIVELIRFWNNHQSTENLHL